MKFKVISAALVAFVAVRAQPQAAADQKFEVASIKPCKAGESFPGMAPDPGGRSQKKGGAPAASPGRLSVGCTPLYDLIRSAYILYATGRLKRDPSAPPITGPDWIKSESYIVSAKAPDGADPGTMWGPMMRALLEDRFQLKIHHESKEAPVYAITVARGGAKLTPFKEGACIAGDLMAPRPPAPEGQKNCQIMFRGIGGANLTFDAQAASLDVVARMFSLGLDRPVIDKTGLPGLFDFHLEFSKDEATPGFALPPPPDGTAPDASDPAPSIFTAIQKYGLRIERTTAPRDHIVIDRVERPTAN